MPEPDGFELAVRSERGETEIRLENSVSRNVLPDNPSLETRKGDRALHGFGMETVCTVVAKYGGSYSRSEEGRRFVQEIVLRIMP